MAFHLSEKKAEELFEIVHYDMWGPYHVPSSRAAHYFLSLLNDCSRGAWLYLMKVKSEAVHFLRSVINMIQTQFSKQVKVLRSDNGVEFKSGHMQAFYRDKGITHC